MSKVVPFRRGPWGAPRKPFMPAVLRKQPSRRFALLLCFIILASAATVAAGAYLVTVPQHPGIVRDVIDAIAARGLNSPETVTTDGVAVWVVDGDSLRTAAGDIRLAGIDAPELHQTCRDADGREWACGRAARDRLRTLASRGRLACSSRERDRYGRALAVCSAGDIADLGEALVLDGYAVHYRGTTRRYAAAEADARAARRGLWTGRFERPEDWRAAQSQ